MLKNLSHEYGIITKTLHWVSAISILPAMAIGIWFAWTDLNSDYGWEQFEIYINWHVGFGLSALVIMLFRLAWRLSNSLPGFQERTSSFQQKLASLTHKLLYISIILTALTGWLGSSLEGHSLSYFSLIEIAPFLGTNIKLAAFMTSAHFYFSWSFILLLVLHLAAVGYHQLWLKDEILKRML